MTTPVSGIPGYTVSAYFDLVAGGEIGDEDRTELLDGIVISAPPQGPLHAAILMGAEEVVRSAIGDRASIRVQMPFLAGARSVPEPDLAVVPGRPLDYVLDHPTQALLVVEIADSSLPFERLTKSRIYAGAGVPEYWIVNLREGCVEVFTRPDIEGRLYAQSQSLQPGATIALSALPGASVAVTDLLPAY